MFFNSIVPSMLITAPEKKKSNYNTESTKTLKLISTGVSNSNLGIHVCNLCCFNIIAIYCTHTKQKILTLNLVFLLISNISLENFLK